MRGEIESLSKQPIERLRRQRREMVERCEQCATSLVPGSPGAVVRAKKRGGSGRARGGSYQWRVERAAHPDLSCGIARDVAQILAERQAAAGPRTRRRRNRVEHVERELRPLDPLQLDDDVVVEERLLIDAGRQVRRGRRRALVLMQDRIARQQVKEGRAEALLGAAARYTSPMAPAPMAARIS
jgi:hypothetical protein